MGELAELSGFLADRSGRWKSEGNGSCEGLYRKQRCAHKPPRSVREWTRVWRLGGRAAVAGWVDATINGVKNVLKTRDRSRCYMTLGCQLCLLFPRASRREASR